MISASRVFKVPNRLAKVVRLPGGKTVAEAVRAADNRIERARDRCVASLEGQVGKLAGFAELAAVDPDAALEGVYRVSNEIFSIAAIFGLEGLSDAAYGLCELVEAFQAKGPANWPAISVHVDGLRMLAAMGDADGSAVAEGLRQVRERFQDPS